jgi:hypothetical protein
MDKAIVKFNNGNLALLCSDCKVIIKTGKDFTKEELELTMGSDKNRLPAQYCEQCKTKQDGNNN